MQSVEIQSYGALHVGSVWTGPAEGVTRGRGQQRALFNLNNYVRGRFALLLGSKSGGCSSSLVAIAAGVTSST